RWWKRGAGSMAVCPMAEVDASAAARIAGSNDGRMIMAESPTCSGTDDSRSAVPKTSERTLRSLALCAALLCAAVVPAKADDPVAPFAPLASVPDYVVTMVEHDRNTEITHTITHHGKWTRIDTIAGRLRTTHYFFPDGPTEIKVG